MYGTLVGHAVKGLVHAAFRSFDFFRANWHVGTIPTYIEILQTMIAIQLLSVHEKFYELSGYKVDYMHLCIIIGF